MRAAVLDESGELTVRNDWPEPEPRPGEVLVALEKVGICGSDVHFVIDKSSKTSYAPIVLGHEPYGRIAGLGEGVTGVSVGDRVAILPLITCMECDRCKAGKTRLCKQRLCIGADAEGCWADFTTVPARNVVPVPDSLSDTLAAVATDSVATSHHSTATQGQVGPGKRVAVWGTGGLGLSAVGIAKALGAEKVIAVDPREEARDWALETGADEAYEPEEGFTKITESGGVDVALEFVGRAETVEKAVRSLDDGGRAVITGVGFEPANAGRIMTFVLRERELVGSYGHEPSDVRRSIELLASGELVLPKVVGDVIPLADVRKGLDRVHTGDTGGSRIVVDITA